MKSERKREIMKTEVVTFFRFLLSLNKKCTWVYRYMYSVEESDNQVKSDPLIVSKGLSHRFIFLQYFKRGIELGIVYFAVDATSIERLRFLVSESTQVPLSLVWSYLWKTNCIAVGVYFVMTREITVLMIILREKSSQRHFLMHWHNYSVLIRLAWFSPDSFWLRSCDHSINFLSKFNFAT